MKNENILNIFTPGQLLAYSGIDGVTDFQSGMVLRTAFKFPGFEIKWPENGGGIHLTESEVKAAGVMLGGDFVVTEKVKGAFVDCHHFLLDGAVEVEPGPGIALLRRGKRCLLGTAAFFRPELIEADIDALIGRYREALLSWPVPAGLPVNGERTLRKAEAQLRTQVCSPEGSIKHRWTTPDRWPHRRMWLWDSVFHAIGLRHLDPGLARDAIAAVLDVQRADGFIPHMAAPDVRSEITQPPVLALGVKLVNEIAPDQAWLRQVYPALKAYLEWDLAHRDTDGAGLLEWFIEADVNCRSGESGMDNSPRFDVATQLDATDFNAFMAQECEIMAVFAAGLGLKSDAEYWSKHHERITRLINTRLWDDVQGFYCDYDVTKNALSPILASSGFLPLICGTPTAAQAAKLVAHLDNPATFKTAFPVPSIAVSCGAYYAKDMWRGPVWININWLIARGLRRYGYQAQADALLDRTMAEIEKTYLHYGTMFEFFDDRNEVAPPQLLRKAKNIPDSFHQAFHDYGWTATLYIDMAFDRTAGKGKIEK